MAKKKTKKEQQPKQKKMVRHLFRRDRVEQKQKEGWKIVPVIKGHFRDELADVILMEKEV